MICAIALICLVGHALCQRLPTSAIPTKYVLRLQPFMDNNTLSGIVRIQFSTTSNQSQPLNSITLNMGPDVTIEERQTQLIDLNTGLKVDIGATLYDDDNTLLKLVLPDGSSLEYSSSYMLTLYFSSLLYSEPTGLFTGYYNSTSKYVASNFRPTFARNAFPCFDEPHFNATVKLQVLRQETYSSVSTADLFSSSPLGGGWMVDQYKPTASLPIHSLGIFISQLNPVNSPMGVVLYAPPSYPSSAPFLEPILQNITIVVGPFPSDPLYLVVLPDRLFTNLASSRFVFTSADIYNHDQQPQPIVPNYMWMSLKLELTEAFLRQYLEFAKTPEWWSHLWLSDSVGAFLAAYLQPQATQVFSWLRSVTRSDAMGEDFSYPTVPIISNEDLTYWEIQNIISNKTIRNRGLSLLSMWSYTLPERVVLTTITQYINLKKSVVTTEDFLNILEANIINAKDIYDVTAAIELLPFWLNSSGYPVLTYSQQSDNSFLLTQSAVQNSGLPDVWPVSISLAQNSSRNWTKYRWGLWLLNSTASFVPAQYNPNQWTLFNLESGLYRLHYGPYWENILAALQENLQPSTTPDSIKALLQDDALALSFVGSLPFSTAFNMLTYADRFELDWYPVVKAFEAFAYRIGDDDRIYAEFGLFAEKLFLPQLLDDLNLLNRSTEERFQYVRSVVSPWLCEFDIGNCREAVSILYDQLLEGSTNNIDAGDLKTVACFGARFNSSAFSGLMESYNNTRDLWLRHLYSIGLGCISNSTDIQSLLTMLISSTSPIDKTDGKNIILKLARFKENTATLTNFITNQAGQIQLILGSDCLSAVITTLGRFRADLSQLQQVANSEDLSPSVVQSAQDSLAKVNANQMWWAEYGPKVDAALPQIMTTTSTSTAVTTLQPKSTLGPSTAIPPTPSAAVRSSIDAAVLTCIIMKLLF